MIKKVEDMRIYIQEETKNMETQKKEIQDCILLVFKLMKIVELMRNHYERVYLTNQPSKFQERIKSSRHFRINLETSYMATDKINLEVLSNKKEIEKINFQFCQSDVLKHLD